MNWDYILGKLWVTVIDLFYYLLYIFIYHIYHIYIYIREFSNFNSDSNLIYDGCISSAEITE